MATTISLNIPNAVAQPLKQYMGNQYDGGVCSHIPEVASPLAYALPRQTWDFAYDKTNDYSGTLPGMVLRTPSTPDLLQGTLSWREYNIQMGAAQMAIFSALTEQALYARSTGGMTKDKIQKITNQEIFGYVIAQLANQIVVRDDYDLIRLVTDSANYSVANTRSIATALPSWTDTHGGELMGYIAEGAEWLNKLAGNQLLKQGVGVNPEIGNDYELVIVVPRNIYQAIVPIWGKVFAASTTLFGYDGNGKEGGIWRGPQAAFFSNLSGYQGAKTILASTYQNESITNILDTSSDDFNNMWEGNSIYMFLTSSNLMKPASVMKPTNVPTRMFNTLILDTNYVKTQAAYSFVNSLEKAFFRINLTLA